MDENLRNLIQDSVEKALSKIQIDKGPQKINVVEVANDENYFTFYTAPGSTGYGVMANAIAQLPSILTIPSQYNGYPVVEIGQNGFVQRVQLNTVLIPDSITTIRNSAFNMCSGLNTVVMFSETPPQLGAYVFANTAADLVIYVPKGTVAAYQNAPGWNQYSSRIQENTIIPDPGASGNTIVNVAVVVPVFNNSNDNIIITSVAGTIGEKSQSQLIDKSQPSNIIR